MKKLTRFQKRLLATLVVAGIALGWGLALLQLNFARGLRNASYDLPFITTSEPPSDIVLVQLDEFSHEQLGQPLAERWDRRIHADLVDKLTAAGAKTIVFDILFYDSFPDEDSRFAEAIKNHGQVILAGEFDVSESTSNSQQRLLLATPDLRRAARGWGLTHVQPDSDGVVRQIRHETTTDFGDKPSLAFKAVEVHQGITTPPPSSHLLNYHGPADTFVHYAYSDVLQGMGIPDDAFRDKLVLVGARQQAALSDAGKDTFPTPYSAHSRALMPGMEIHATAIANLVEGSAMGRFASWVDFVVITAAALLLTAFACLLSPPRGIPLTILLGLAICAAGYYFHRSEALVLNWTIPAFGQTPVIIALALASHYLIEYSARWKLRRAFKSYMSDEQARQIDEDEVSLELGGKEVEATILFSDLAGFTSMSEGLPPQSVSKALISYFESATAGILDNNGTIIKYVGDAVMATWGAPLKVDREADRAIDAAIQMQFAGRQPITLETESGTREQALETRIGINTGPGLAGNLGSKRRFDYSVIGDTTNTAARLEGLNKMLGTSILVTEAVLQKCENPGQFAMREMGSFILKGKNQGVVVYEILGHEGEESVRERSTDYLENYRRGLEAFRSGDWDEAQARLTAALGQHDRLSEDPASRLLLNALSEAVEAADSPDEWKGEVRLTTK